MYHLPPYNLAEKPLEKYQSTFHNSMSRNSGTWRTVECQSFQADQAVELELKKLIPPTEKQIRQAGQKALLYWDYR